MLLLSKFVIFVIKLNPICPYNNPKLQNFFKKSEVASKGIIYSCEQLHLRFGGFPRSDSAELHRQGRNSWGGRGGAETPPIILQAKKFFFAILREKL